MPTITGGKYIHYNSKRLFAMSTAIAVDGSTNAPAEAVQGSIGVTTHNTGKSYWFVSNGTKWIANGGAVSSTAFADITGAAGDNASLATALGLLAPKANAVFTGTFRIPTATPASATAAGTAGQIAWDANFIYVCIAPNTWKRTAISTWP